MANIYDWMAMCAETEEFVTAFNRLYGTQLSFRAKPVSPIVAAVDRACGFDRSANEPRELEAFVAHCADLWLCIPEVAAAA